MKNLLIVLFVGLGLVGCAGSAINISADIPKEQEVTISIETKKTSD
jgi:uncharacterized protein YceK|tara:strand:+ start:3052 stop:3189 length:138 start_codon:yes stop_codon:yes gene_type:complete